MKYIYAILLMIGALLVLFITSFLWWMLFYFFRGKRIIHGSHRRVKERSFLYRIFVSFPRRLALDRYNNNPDEFKLYGVHIIAGEQGSGKSITLTYLLNKYRKEYPLMHIKTNYAYKYETAPIVSYHDILNSNNGIYGEIDVLDEVQNWFNSLQSKDFPPEMMTEITQQRKQRKCIFGTSQVFSRVAKPIREQTTFLYEPITIAGCLTIVRMYKHTASADGLTDKKKLRKVFFFVHSDHLRESFDTYKKIERYKNEGFTDRNRQIA